MENETERSTLTAADRKLLDRLHLVTCVLCGRQRAPGDDHCSPCAEERDRERRADEEREAVERATRKRRGASVRLRLLHSLDRWERAAKNFNQPPDSLAVATQRESEARELLKLTDDELAAHATWVDAQ